LFPSKHSTFKLTDVPISGNEQQGVGQPALKPENLFRQASVICRVFDQKFGCPPFAFP
jgi:hypothetical protein